jgi:hypothetical protein
MVTGINMLTFNNAKNQVYLPLGGNFTTVLQCYNNKGTPYSGVTGGVFSGYIIINYTNDFTHIPEVAVGSVATKLSTPSLLYACTSTLTTTSLTSTSTSTSTTAVGSVSTTLTSTSTTSSTSTSTTMPSGIYYVPITFTNAQGVPTASPFQQSMTVNSVAYQAYINSNWNNVEFTMGPAATGNVMQAWVESNPSNTATNTVVWVNLPSAIAANSNTVVYMDFMTSNVMSSSGPTGEAPQLSASYGQYDSGRQVFSSFYDNFAGTTINSAWNVNGVNGWLTVNNGISLAVSGVTGCAFTLKNTYTGPLTVDAYQYLTTNAILGTNLGSSFSNWQTSSTPCPVISGALQKIQTDANGINILQGMEYAPNDLVITNHSSVNSVIPQVTSLEVSSTNSLVYQNYKNELSKAGAFNIMSGNTYPGIITEGHAGTLVYATWFRIRPYPPGNVMPTTAFGALSYG